MKQSLVLASAFLSVLGAYLLAPHIISKNMIERTKSLLHQMEKVFPKLFAVEKRARSRIEQIFFIFYTDEEGNERLPTSLEITVMLIFFTLPFSFIVLFYWATQLSGSPWIMRAVLITIYILASLIQSRGSSTEYKTRIGRVLCFGLPFFICILPLLVVWVIELIMSIVLFAIGFMALGIEVVVSKCMTNIYTCSFASPSVVLGYIGLVAIIFAAVLGVLASLI